MNISFNDPSRREMIELEIDINVIDANLKGSEGDVSMSDIDVKLTIMSLKSALENQMKINETLISRLDKLEKKFSLRFWKK